MEKNQTLVEISYSTLEERENKSEAHASQARSRSF